MSTIDYVQLLPHVRAEPSTHLAGTFYDAYKIFLVLPCLSIHMSTQKGKMESSGWQ